MCMQEGRTPKEWRMGLIVPTWKSKRDVHDPGKNKEQEHHNTHPIIETIEEGYRRNDREKS